MILFKEIEQGSPEWLRLRLGKVTGSCVKDVMKSDNLSLVDDIIAQIVSETIEETYTSAAMQRGNDLEPLARGEYEKVTGRKVEQVGFMLHEEYDWLGVSPDGLIKIDGKYKKGIEIKCPNTATHVKYIRQNQLPNEYKYQVQSYFIVNEDLEEVDFISYDNRFVVKPLHIVTVTRESIKDELAATEEALVKFWEKVQKYYTQILF